MNTELYLILHTFAEKFLAVPLQEKTGAELFLEALVHEREHFRAPEALDDDRAGRCLAASEAVHGRNVITLVKSWSLEARQHALLVEEFRPAPNVLEQREGFQAEWTLGGDRRRARPPICPDRCQQ